MIIIKEPTERNPYRHFLYEDSKGREWKYRVCSDLGAELERLYKKKYTGKSCFIVSAFRPEDSEEINNKNADILSENIRSSGLGQIRIMASGTETAFFVPKPEDFSDEAFSRTAEKLNGEKISFSADAVRQYFSELTGGKNPEFFAVRNPNSFTQAVLMDINKENLLFKVK